MNNFFETNMIVKSSQCDSISMLRPSAVLEIFQDIAEFHALEMGISAPLLTKRDGAFWVLSKSVVRFDEGGKRIRQGESIVARTWPLLPDGFRCHRQYAIRRNGEDCPIVSGVGEWVLVDTETRRLRTVETTGYPLDMEHLTDIAVERPFSRMKDILSPEEKVAERVIVSSFIDLPHHTNNIVYCTLFLDTFSVAELETMKITSLEIHYLHETREGDTVHILRRAEPDGFRFSVRSADGTTAVLAYIKTE